VHQEIEALFYVEHPLTNGETAWLRCTDVTRDSRPGRHEFVILHLEEPMPIRIPVMESLANPSEQVEELVYTSKYSIKGQALLGIIEVDDQVPVEDEAPVPPKTEAEKPKRKPLRGFLGRNEE
jgi:hypothetical protein